MRTPGQPPHHSPHAFTLIELVVVIAVVGVLMALAMSFTSRAMSRARSAESLSNLRQVGVAALLFASEKGGRLPLATGGGELWIEQIWPYAYPGQEYPGFAGSDPPEKFKGTIFHSPNVERERPPMPRSFGWNYISSLSFPTMQAVAIDNHSKVCLAADTRTSSALSSAGINFRNGSSRDWANDGRAHVLFMDGHVEAMTKEQVPDSNYSIFWRGVDPES